jgi:hypothetical protein
MKKHTGAIHELKELRRNLEAAENASADAVLEQP